MSSLPIACDLTALTSDERARHALVMGELQTVLKEVRELDDGYAFCYPVDALFTVAEWMALERRCCPFFTFALEIAPGADALWVRLTGGEGVKQFLQAELGIQRSI